MRTKRQARQHISQKTSQLKPSLNNQHDQDTGRLTESLLILEPRVLFDGAALITGAEIANDPLAQQEAEIPNASEPQAQEDSNNAQSQNTVFDSLMTLETPSDRRELVFIDTSIKEYQRLLAGINLNAEIVLLDTTRNGIEQIANTLRNRTGVDAIHIVSHGSQGELQLGTGKLTLDSMNHEYADELSVIKQALSNNADLLIYGCNFGEGQTGQAAAARLAQLTGADIAASGDLTGNNALGGDWNLEVTTGAIETAVAITAQAQQAWSGLLDITNNLVAHYAFDEGAGTTATDSTANNNDGTHQNSPSHVAGHIGSGAIDFSGDADNSNAHVTVLDDPSLDISGDFSVAFWYNSTITHGSLGGLVGSRGADSQGFDVSTNAANDLKFRVFGDGLSFTVTDSGGFIPDGQWHHVVATRADKVLRIYSDGTETAASASANAIITGTAPLRLGAIDSTNNDYEGKLDDVRLYSRSLSATDVTELYNDGSNDAPTITNLGGDTLAYTEGDGAVVIDQGASATVTDADSADFDTGTLTVAFTAGSDNAEDVLAIRNQGTGAGQIGVSGANVTYGGTTIGTFAGGSGGANLVTTLNSNANAAAVSALTQNITYENTDTNNPTTGARTVRYVVTDGDGGTSANYDTTVTVTTVNDAPVLDNTGTMVLTNIAENDTSSAGDTVAAIIASAGGNRITDVDTGAVEGLAIIGVDNTNGTWQYNAGSGWTAFGAVTNTNAVLLDTTSSIRFVPNASYTGTAGTITFRAWDTTTGSDGDTGVDVSTNGGTTAYSTATETATLTVTAVNNAPVITNLGGDTLAYTEGDGAVVIDQSTNAAVTDGDSANFDTGTLTVSFTAGSDNAEDVLAIRDQGAGAGNITVSGNTVSYGGTQIGTFAGGRGGSNLVITFDSDATPTAVSALVQNITYENIDTNAPTTGARTVRYVLTDGDGGTSANYDTTVTVSGQNDAPTFSVGDGEVLSDLGTGTVDHGYATAVQTDGKILVAGESNNQFVLTRYNTDGTIDTSFAGGAGSIMWSVDTYNRATKILLQNDGKILVVGAADTSDLDASDGVTETLVITRYQSDGTLDTSFGGGDGISTIASVVYTGKVSAALQSDGNLVIGTYYYDGSQTFFRAMRLDTSGNLDTGFGASGYADVNFGSIDLFGDIVIKSDGRIVLAGSAAVSGKFQVGVAQLTSSGVLDTSFSGDGKVTTVLGPTTSHYRGLAVTVQDDGKIVVAGSNGATGGGDSSLIRYNADGSLDTSFGGSGTGYVTTSLSGSYDLFTSVRVLDNGKILAAGFDGSLSSGKLTLVQYTSSGVLDTSFGGGDGMVVSTVTNFIGKPSLAQAADGSIIVAAGQGNDTVLLSFNSDGSANLAFDPVNTLDGNPTFTEGGSAVVLDSNVQTFDKELSNSNNFSGATLTLARNGGANAQDVYSATGTLGSISGASGNVVVGGTTIGTYTHSGGTLVFTFNANATNTLVNQAMQQIAYSNSSHAPPASVQVDWTFSDGNTGAQGTGGALAATGSVTVTITAANDVPVITNLGGDTLAYTEGDGAQVIDQSTNAAVTDVDSANFDTGTLTVSFTAGSDSAEDVLAIQNVGTGAGQIGVSGANVTYGGTTIGTFAGGSGGANLVITLNSNADAAAVSALVQNITYENTNIHAPILGSRHVNYVLTDGDGGTSVNYDTIVNLTSTTANLEGHWTFDVDATDSSGNHYNGTLSNGAVVDTADATDKVGEGKLSLDGSNDYVDLSAHVGNVSGLTEGTISGWIKTNGTLQTIFSVSDTADANSYVALFLGASGYVTFEVVENGTKSLATYNGNGPTINDGTWHHVAVTVSASGNKLYLDGQLIDQADLVYDAGSAATATFFDDVSGLDAMTIGRNENSSGGRWHTNGLIDDVRLYGTELSAAEISALATNVPVITNLGGDTLAYSEGDGAVVIDQGAGAAVTDIDSSNFDTGTLTIAFTAGSDNAEDVLAIRDQGTGAGQIGISGANVTYAGTTIGTFAGGTGGADLVITLNSNADAAAVSALTQNISYENTDTDNPTAGSRTVRYVVTDGDGGTSANYDTTVTVTAVNDAPVLDNAGTMVLTNIAEDDTSSAGDTVAAIIASAGGNRITDVDTGAVEGLAVIGVDDTNGTWQYNAGSGWTAFGAVTNTNAVLLDTTSSIRFVPNASYTGSAGTITFRAWDTTTGSDGDTGVDVSTNGGTTAYSTATETATLTVTAVNDAPVLTPSTPTLTTITENDTTNSGNTISSIVTTDITDVDSGAVEGLAITSLNSSNGTWQYNAGGGWTDVGAVSNTSALLLRSTDSLRFVPDAQNADTASVTYRAWDQTTGSAGTKVDVSTNGGTTAFSTATDTATITVTAVNDAPVLDNAGTMVLTNIAEDDTSSAGDTLAAIIASAGGNRITDVDTGAVEGLAIIGVDNTNGTWQYNAGSGWTAFGAVTNTNAVLLDTTSSIRFVPNASYTGTAGTITFRAWDTTTGSNGDTGVDVSTNGGITAYSTATETATLTVTAVNDAPVLTPSTPTLTTITENDTTNSGNTISSIVTTDITDVDSGAVEGLAITSLNSSNGTWQYNAGGGWTDVGAVSNTSALLLRSTDSLRFVPDAQNADTASVTYRAWDQTTGSAGTKVDVSTNGGTTAFSTATDTATITVTAVNDDPTITSDGGASTANVNVVEGNTSVTTVTATDVDLPADTLSYSFVGGADQGFFNIDANSGALTFHTAPAFASPADANMDNIYVVQVQVRDGNGAIDTQTIHVTITDTNTAPIINSNGGGATANVNVAEGTTAITTVSATDVDLPGDTLSFRLVGGSDASRFHINNQTGALTFQTAPDFENPADANLDNVYELTVEVTDGNGGTDTQTLLVSVTNIVEAPALIPEPPQNLEPATEPDTESVTNDTEQSLTQTTPRPSIETQSPLPAMLLTEATPDRSADQSGSRVEFGSTFDTPLEDLSATYLSDLTAGKLLTVADSLFNQRHTVAIDSSMSAIPVDLDKQLDELAHQLQETIRHEQTREQMVSGVTTGTGVTISAGYLAWVLRGTSLLTSLFASLPAWGHFDPLPVLTGGFTARQAEQKGNQVAADQENQEHQGIDKIFRDSQ